MSDKASVPLAAKRFTVWTKAVRYVVLADNPHNAMRDFMRRVMIEVIGMEDLGQIGMVLEEGKSEDDAIAFRIAPAMFNLGRIDAKSYVAMLKENISPDISMADAMKMAKKDRWLTEVIGR